MMQHKSRLAISVAVSAYFLVSTSLAGNDVHIRHDIVIDSDKYDGVGEGVAFLDPVEGGHITVTIVDGGELEDAKFRGHTVATMRGGRISDDAQILDNASLTMFAGTIWALDVAGESFTMRGGQIGELETWGRTRSDIYGGAVMELDLYDESELHLHGTGLSYLDGVVTGTLSDGLAIDWGITQNDQSRVILHTVPEAGMPVPILIAVGLLWARRRSCRVDDRSRSRSNRPL